MRFYSFILLTFFFFTTQVTAQQTKQQTEVLLIGTFHFNNPGADLAKTDKFNVLTKEAQQELEFITNKIKRFSPDKIFVEWDVADSLQLDSLYNLYLQNNYFDFVAKKYPGNAFFKENEIFQLAFRTAQKTKLQKVYGIDMKTEFAFDSLLFSLERAQQTDLKNRIFNRIKEFEQIDNANRQKYNLTQLILECNKQQNRDFDLGSYITLFNRAGVLNDVTGADLVTSWYKRNLYMYSLVQKLTQQTDKKIVVLLGASHIALFKQFVDLDENFKVVELKTILEK